MVDECSISGLIGIEHGPNSRLKSLIITLTWGLHHMVSELTLVCSYSLAIHLMTKQIQSFDDIYASINTCFSKIREWFDKINTYFKPISTDTQDGSQILAYRVDEHNTDAMDSVDDHAHNVDDVSDQAVYIES